MTARARRTQPAAAGAVAAEPAVSAPQAKAAPQGAPAVALTGVAWIDQALVEAFGPDVGDLRFQRASTEALSARATTEGGTITLSPDVALDSAEGLEILGEEVAHALADGGSGATSVDLPGDPGEAAAKATGRRFAAFARGGGDAPTLGAAQGGRARVHRRAVEPTTWGGSPVLSRGSKGSWVRQLQTLLNAHGHGLSVDGDFGPRTEAAVRAFQRAKGLVVDGIAGPQTAGALRAGGQQQAPAPGGGQPAPQAGGVTGNPVMARGAKGATVEALQRLLNTFDAGLRVDGDFGNVTDAAVRGFQRANGLTVDGRVGPVTAGKLNDPSSRKITAAPQNNGQTPAQPPPANGDRRLNGDPGNRLGHSNMNPDVRRLANQVISSLQGQGLYPYVVDGYRSFADQNAAYERGNSQVRGGGSWHNYGLAVDFAWWDAAGRTVTWDAPQANWNALGATGKGAGFTAWGGDWGWDRPHLEYHPNWPHSSAYGVKPTYDRGGYQAVWDLVT